jgi:hypothetical protein
VSVRGAIREAEQLLDNAEAASASTLFLIG